MLFRSLFILSDSPPEKDVQWSDEGIKSSYKFMQKLWVLHQKIIIEIEANHPPSQNNNLEKITNKFLKEVTYNIENFSYNKIIANMHEAYSGLNKVMSNKIEKVRLIENYKKVLIAISPVIPHFSSECMEMMKSSERVYWPKFDENFLMEENVKFVIQFNGKTRKIIESKKDIGEDILIEKIKEDHKLSVYLNEKNVLKKIFIPNKLINIITN